jgi:PAS domain S-box-containing protein
MDPILKNILEGTVGETGEEFFAALVKNLALAMDVSAAWVTEYVAEYRHLKTLAFWMDGALVPEMDLTIKDTPCEVVLEKGRTLRVVEEVAGEFPDDPDLKTLGMIGYLGIPFKDSGGVVVGHLAVMDRKPLKGRENAFFIMRIFAARAAAELRRIRAEARVVEREEKLASLLDTAPDAILELDDALTIRLFNRAARTALGVANDEGMGRSLSDFLVEKSRGHLQEACRGLSAKGKSPAPIWVPEMLAVRAADGSTFPAEATLSRTPDTARPVFILILRNINDRLAAEEKIRSLSRETERLKAEIRSLGNFDAIIGASLPLMRLLKDVDQVAGTDATVLIIGETGTGKELIARAIHDGSRRREGPLIKVNCAAIPHGLMESEFFGHEKGAFTGATQRRTGRFALADGGTLFLDEVAELDPDLQAKLLRALQEGEFEPVGSNRARKVDVRVIAATNRDLRAAADAGRFREDLYFRLNVFPLTLPPLRERGDDVILLSQAFLEKAARQLGRDVAPLSPADIARLKGYAWPGNVRELQNVIERAVITAEGGRLNLDRALPETAGLKETQAPDTAADVSDDPPILTAAQMTERERDNLRRALDATHWRVSGDNGAARLLGMPPSTLTSRLKALGLKRP